jgi:leader peptidase (prepilin peptidase)/N-methyltransferase
MAVIFFIFGLLIGSFINVCICRLPKKESVVSPRSYCPSCQHPVRSYDNIPVLSFLFLRGRCRDCHASISWQYPAVELIHAIGYFFIFNQFGLSIETLIYALFFSALMTITVIDLYHQIIPDSISLPGIVIGLLAASTVLPTGPKAAVIGLLLGGGLFYAIAILSVVLLKKEGMGGGDIKLVAMIGALLGWQKVLLVVFLASIMGSIVGIVLIATRLRGRQDPIPFGPFLAVGAMIAVFVGNDIIDWYF